LGQMHGAMITQPKIPIPQRIVTKRNACERLQPDSFR
jgi:hypothetical protein